MTGYALSKEECGLRPYYVALQKYKLVIGRIESQGRDGPWLYWGLDDGMNGIPQSDPRLCSV